MTFGNKNNKSQVCEISDSHRSDYENYCLLGYDGVQFGRYVPWRNLVPASSRQQEEKGGSSEIVVCI
jgi:hypothetical protein